MTQRVYICPEDCSFFLGEDGCKRQDIDTTATYEKEGGHPVCPFYMKDLLAGKGITLDEAIKEGQQWLSGHPHLAGLKPYLAIRLGIEALKRIQGARHALMQFGQSVPNDLLPGETQ